MKIDRRDFLVGSGLLLTAGAVSSKAQRQTPASVAANGERKTSVYTTAKDTEYRLSPTGPLEFKQHGQPLETQTCVFVDPSKQFETFIGIGGALTDASAETFAKLPPNRQQELIDAYFDPAKGIGYTLA